MTTVPSSVDRQMATGARSIMSPISMPAPQLEHVGALWQGIATPAPALFFVRLSSAAKVQSPPTLERYKRRQDGGWSGGSRVSCVACRRDGRRVEAQAPRSFEAQAT